MKSFLAKNWKRILIIIAIIFIMINIVNKCIAPHRLVSEYAKYGPNVTKSAIEVNSSETLSSVRESLPVSDGIFKIGIILAIGLVAAVIISEISNKKAPAKKK